MSLDAHKPDSAGGGDSPTDPVPVGEGSLEDFTYEATNGCLEDILE